jgi:hypothetical protein
MKSLVGLSRSAGSLKTTTSTTGGAHIYNQWHISIQVQSQEILERRRVCGLTYIGMPHTDYGNTKATIRGRTSIRYHTHIVVWRRPST